MRKRTQSAGPLLLAALFSLSCQHILAFQTFHPSGFDVALTDERGERTVLLTGNGCSGLHYHDRCWSPDGKRLAFSTGTGGVHEIWIVNADGTGMKQMTHLGQYSIFHDWSPDGRSILVKTGPNDGRLSVCTIDVATGTLATLAEGECGYPVRWSSEGKGFVTDYSPAGWGKVLDGGKGRVTRVFSHDRSRLVAVLSRDRESDVLISSADGRDERRLAELPGMFLTDFAWSPDDELIAFSAKQWDTSSPFPRWCIMREDGDDDPRTGIYVVRADGSDLRQIAEYACRPVWRPCGQVKDALAQPTRAPAAAGEQRH